MTLHIKRPEAENETGHFTFRGQGGYVSGHGDVTQVPYGPSLEARIGRFLGQGGVIGGALPFDAAQDDHLWWASVLDRRGAPPPASAMPVMGARLRADPPARDYAGIVARALGIMAAEQGLPDGLAKIVLARALVVMADRAIPVSPLLAALALDPAVTAFHVPLPARGGQSRTMVGATPELLVRKSGSRVSSHPLAGSARRCADPVADTAAAEALSRSDKDRREHAIVVEYILDTLGPLCVDLSCPEGTQLTATQTMWHLGTRIEGRLRDADMPSALLAARLHPTPAVCGLPRDRAAALIRDLEAAPRDFYAGAVGWCDAAGDGMWYVAIRCAEICGTEARLFAGAGIVPGSDPWAEVAETGAKFGALLSALGLPPDAALVTTED